MHLIFFSKIDRQTGVKNLEKKKQLPFWEDSCTQKLIDKCYHELSSPNAHQEASKKESHKLKNFLLRLRDSATFIEANQAMKSGNIGSLLNMWRMWSTMAQGIKGISKYAIQLSQIVCF